jgi:hypothetical protein
MQCWWYWELNRLSSLINEEDDDDDDDDNDDDDVHYHINLFVGMSNCKFAAAVD